jgi:hypothetical protein
VNPRKSVHARAGFSGALFSLRSLRRCFVVVARLDRGFRDVKTR